METTIFKRFRESNKWKDFFDFESFECKMSLIFSIFGVLLLCLFDVYSNFGNYITPLQNISVNIATGFISLLGIILAGIGIVIGILNKDTIKSINKRNDSTSIYNVLISFEFLAFIIGLGIIGFELLHISLYSPNKIFPKPVFYGISLVILYYFTFLIFYTISLIGNCIRVFYISNLYKEIDDTEKRLIDIANEIRIDFILSKILNEETFTKEKFSIELNQFVDKNNIINKEELQDYLKKYYKF